MSEEIIGNFQLYVDSQHRLQFDKQTGLLGVLKRTIRVLLGYGKYDIFTVFKTALEIPPVGLLDHAVVMQISKNLGKKLKVESQLITRLFYTIQSAQNGLKVENELHLLSETCVHDSKRLKSLQELQKHFASDSAGAKVLSSLFDEVIIKSKWNAMGFNPELAHKYFDEVRFLVKTRLIYSIRGYQNTTATGLSKHAIQEGINPANGNKELRIKKEGKWVSVKKIKEQLIWDSKETMLASKSNPHERWNYFDNGLVPTDRFYHHEAAAAINYPEQNASLHPVAKLSSKEMCLLLNRAKTFNGFRPESSNTGQTDCVIQFITNPRPLFEKEWLQNLNAQVPVHCGIRVILADGTVYSTGFGSTLHEDTYNEGMNKYLGTINGQPTIMDYEEFRPHQGRIVTNIPVNDQKAQAILAHLNLYRKESIRFNIIKQNCMRLGTNILSMAGTDLNIRLPFNEMLHRTLPDLEIVPVFGKPLKSLKGRVTDLSKSVEFKMPEIVKETFSLFYDLVFYIPSKIGLLVRNLLVLAMGGLVASPKKNPLSIIEPNDLEEMDSLDQFSQLLNGLTDEHASDIQHSSIFINWQLQQASTDVHQYSGQPNMNILPPALPAQQEYSAKRKKEFVEIYKESTVVGS